MTRVSLHESVKGVRRTSRAFVTGPFHSHEKAWEDPCATPASVAFLLRDSRRGGRHAPPSDGIPSAKFNGPRGHKTQEKMKNLIQAMRSAFMATSVPAGLTPQSRQTLDLLMEDFQIPASWGIHGLQQEGNALCFEVNGFLFKGKVTVTHNGEGVDATYDIALTGEDGTRRNFAWIGPQELVDTIDSLVEKDALYEQRVSEAYGINV